MNIEQFARKLSDKEESSSLFKALRTLRSACKEQLKDGGFGDWIPWGVDGPPAEAKA